MNPPTEADRGVGSDAFGLEVTDAEMQGLLELLRAAGRLKRVRRQGWVDRGITDAESVADHSFRNALIAWVLGARAGLDTNRLVKLMLVHDLAEAVVGDATPYGHLIEHGADPADAAGRWRELVDPAVSATIRAAKHERERGAIGDLTAATPAGVSREIRDLWEEYDARVSPEADFAGQVDKLEALLQATEYDAVGEPADVENFLASAREVVTHPVLLRALDAIVRDRA